MGSRRVVPEVAHGVVQEEELPQPLLTFFSEKVPLTIRKWSRQARPMEWWRHLTLQGFLVPVMCAHLGLGQGQICCCEDDLSLLGWLDQVRLTVVLRSWTGTRVQMYRPCYWLVIGRQGCLKATREREKRKRSDVRK